MGASAGSWLPDRVDAGRVSGAQGPFFPLPPSLPSSLPSSLAVITDDEDCPLESSPATLLASVIHVGRPSEPRVCAAIR